MVLVPLGADQFLHSGRCAALGAARSLEADGVTPDTVRATVGAVLSDPAPGRVARALGDEIAAMPGPEHGVALLEELARTGVPPPWV